ncbi:MAG: hypothetical protein EPN48_00580 [Microbacteriaceae bacterium]|nr:MAG: hypothetical protein EPN48_00580 [Microbacteriaceae bacterium]
MVNGRQPPRVFLGTQEISGLYRNLEIGMVGLGVSARLIITHPHPFAYDQLTPNPWPARIATAAVLRHRRTSGMVRYVWAIAFAVASAILLVWSLSRFDAYVFGWGLSILPGNLDLPILRLFRKRVVVVMGHGSEARPPYMSTPEEGTTLLPTKKMLGDLELRTRRVSSTVRRIERWSNVVIGLPTTGQFFSKPFVNFYRLGVATAESASPSRHDDDLTTARPIVVLHVPSNPRVKGSAVIRACMAEVVAEFPSVTFREVTGVPHDEVLTAIRECTFVVDQLWSDIPMAAVGAEAAAEGRAAVISGYAWDTWASLLRPEDMPPTILTTPEALKTTIVDAIQQIEATRAIGEAARRFVRSRWNVSAVAANYLRVVTGNIPAEWIVAPADVRYGWGCGVSKEKVETMVVGLVSTYGQRALRWRSATQAYDFLAGKSAAPRSTK